MVRLPVVGALAVLAVVLAVVALSLRLPGQGPAQDTAAAPSPARPATVL